MFKLSIYDRNGIELKLGDIVSISDGKKVSFYCEVTYLHDEMILSPFHTFSFHSVSKVNSLPQNAIKSNEKRFNMWYVSESATDENAKDHEKYLASWRECEIQIEKSCFRIELLESKKQLSMF